MNRMPMIRFLAVTAGISLAAMFCAGPKTAVRTGEPAQAHPVVRMPGDTIRYQVSFRDKSDRGNFVRAFQLFLDKYPFGAVSLDSAGACCLVRILPPQPLAADSIGVERVGRGEFVEEVIETAAQQQRIEQEKEKPVFGGTAVFHTGRPFLDDFWSALVCAAPFDPPADSAGAPAPPYAVTLGSPRKIMVAISENLKNAAGQPASVFDWIQLWTDYVREHPAEGAALLRHVRGVVPFTRGTEAVITGLSAAGPRAVVLQLEREDPDALDRLGSGRLFPAGFNLGPFQVKKQDAETMQLAANASAASGRAFLDACTIVLKEDRNPVLSLSLGKYDGAVLSLRKDLDYVRRSMPAGIRLEPLPEQRYFIAAAAQDRAVRDYCAGLINAKEILSAAIKAEGRVIADLMSDSGETPAAPVAPSLQKPPFIDRPLSLAYRKDDPVSVLIAEKVLADFSRVGLDCTLKGMAAVDYEKTLVARASDLAVGWVDAGLIGRHGEQLRVAALWFDDVADERLRIQERREIPLCAVKRYLACTAKIGMAGARAADLFRRTP